MRRQVLAVAALALAATAQAQRPPRTDPCAVREQLFLSPAGEPFRSPPGAPAPVALWFAGADRDGDGRLTSAEVQADAMRFFGTIDRDGSGEITPDELTRYEGVVPEIGIYQPGPTLPVRRGRRDVYGGPLGGGRFGLLNIPNPIAAADTDFNRGTTRAEMAAAVARGHALWARGGAPRLDELSVTPQAAMLTACAAAAARRRR